MREVITLQFGHYSNFIGSHYWNTQQGVLDGYKPLMNNYMVPNFRPEVATNVLFREARGGYSIHSEDQPSSYFPRVLVFDLKGSRGSLRKTADPYQSVDKEYINEQKNITRWDKLEVMKTFEMTKQTKFTKQQLSKNENTRELVIDDQEESESVQTQEPQQKKQKKEYSRTDIELDLEENVSLWSDYLQVDFHDKTICEPLQFQFEAESFNSLNFDSSQGFSMNSAFDIYSTGREVLHGNFSLDQYDDFSSQLMYFVEECDNLDGFQIFTDSFNAWGLTCKEFIEMVKDEVGTKIPIITYASSPYIPSFASDSDRSKFILNTCLTYCDLYENSSLFIPNSAQQLESMTSSSFFSGFDPRKMYHSSSVMAAAFDSISLAYRLNGQGNKQIGMHTYAQEMAPLNSLKIANINLAFPYAYKMGSSLYQNLRGLNPIHQNNCFTPLLSNIASGYDSESPFAHSLILRGLNPVHVPLYHDSDLKELDEIRMKKYGGEELEKYRHLIGCNSHSEMLENYMGQTRSYSKHAFHVNQAFQTPFTFPNILNTETLSEAGFLREAGSNTVNRVESCPLGAYLSNSRNFVEHIKELNEYFDMLNGGLASSLFSGGGGGSTTFRYKISKDEMKEYKETMGRMYDNYEDS